MPRPLRRLVYLLLPGLMLLLTLAATARAELGQAPPRISLISGSAHFWRPGDTAWADAQLNLPLAPGDALHTGEGGVLEIQLGPRSFLRLPQDSYVQWLDATADALHFTVNTGNVSLDLRSLAEGEKIIIDAPNASYTLDGAGSYRLEVLAQESHLNIRHGGRAMVSLNDGRSYAISNGEQAVVRGMDSIDAQSLPIADAWDEWNEDRTRALLNPVTSASRQLADDMYGAYELDRYGTWQTVESHGAVWRPSNVPVGWTPYSSGKWVYDSVFGWSWVDQSPWGWAPYHYGQWLKINNIWFWAPGNRSAAVRYAPAPASPHLLLPPRPQEAPRRYVAPFAATGPRPAYMPPVVAAPRWTAPAASAPAPAMQAQPNRIAPHYYQPGYSPRPWSEPRAGRYEDRRPPSPAPASVAPVSPISPSVPAVPAAAPNAWRPSGMPNPSNPSNSPRPDWRSAAPAAAAPSAAAPPPAAAPNPRPAPIPVPRPTPLDRVSELRPYPNSPPPNRYPGANSAPTPAPAPTATPAPAPARFSPPVAAPAPVAVPARPAGPPPARVVTSAPAPKPTPEQKALNDINSLRTYGKVVEKP